jgi:hypothetical protein
MNVSAMFFTDGINEWTQMWSQLNHLQCDTRARTAYHGHLNLQSHEVAIVKAKLLTEGCCIFVQTVHLTTTYPTKFLKNPFI